MRILIILPALTLALSACGGASPDARPTPPIAQTPDYQGTQAVAGALAQLQAQAQATEAQSTQIALQLSNEERALAVQETQVALQVANDNLSNAHAYATLEAQHATATQAAALSTREAYERPTQLAQQLQAQHDEQDRNNAITWGAFVLAAVLIFSAFIGFFFVVFDKQAAHNRATLAQAMAASTKILQVGQMVVVVVGGEVVDTYTAEPGAQVVEHGPQLAPPQRDPRTARALQFLEVAIACPKPDDPKRWPANRLPTYDMLRQFGARDFDTGSAWQDTVKLFGELVDGTPGKGAFVTAPTLEEFYQQLAAGKVALPQRGANE